jgi:hypothetical protein
MIYRTSTDSPRQYTSLSYSVDTARPRGYDAISEFEAGDSGSYYLMNGLGKVGRMIWGAAVHGGRHCNDSDSRV